MEGLEYANIFGYTLIKEGQGHYGHSIYACSFAGLLLIISNLVFIKHFVQFMLDTVILIVLDLKIKMSWN